MDDKDDNSIDVTYRIVQLLFGFRKTLHHILRRLLDYVACLMRGALALPMHVR